jgi:alpha-galactosidase
MRTDYALLSRFQLQSTSDQQDFLRYPAIAAAAPTAITPEQAAVWACPQAEWSDDEIAFTMCGALLGRLHLSGHISRMRPAQQQLIADAISAYKRIRTDLAAAFPFWPLGLPGWTDSWIALGMAARSATYLIVWHRGRVGDALGPGERVDPAEIVFPVAHLRDQLIFPEVRYPMFAGAEVEWRAPRGELIVALPRTPSACLIGLQPNPSHAG